MRVILIIVFITPQGLFAMHEFRFGALLASVLSAALLAGCGQKGPLYLPQTQAKPSASEPAPAPAPRP